MKMIYQLLTMLQLMTTMPSYAMNCQKAKSVGEKAVCVKCSLNDQDRILNKIYYSVAPKQTDQEKFKLKIDQADWLKKREACNASCDYLRKIYESRITTLRTLECGLAPEEQILLKNEDGKPARLCTWPLDLSPNGIIIYAIAGTIGQSSWQVIKDVSHFDDGGWVVTADKHTAVLVTTTRADERQYTLLSAGKSNWVSRTITSETRNIYNKDWEADEDKQHRKLDGAEFKLKVDRENCPKIPLDRSVFLKSFA